MARRRRKLTGKVNIKLMMDVMGASLAVQLLPGLIQRFVPLDATLYTVAGAGGGFVAGNLLGRPDMANASLALGVMEFVTPLVNDLLGGGVKMLPESGAPAGMIGAVKKEPAANIADYIRLNEYSSTPYLRRGYNQYSDSY